MKTNHIWKTVAVLALVAQIALVSDVATAQSRAKKVKASSANRVVIKAPKAGVLTQGSFTPKTVRKNLTPAKPATTMADLKAAGARRTVLTTRTVNPSAQTFSQISLRNFGTTGLIIPRTGAGWWGGSGPTVTTTYDPVYGSITVVDYEWGSVMYTYGYQVVNYWNGNGYIWYAYPGQANVAYPVLYR